MPMIGMTNKRLNLVMKLQPRQWETNHLTTVGLYSILEPNMSSYSLLLHLYRCFERQHMVLMILVVPIFFDLLVVLPKWTDYNLYQVFC